MTYARKTFLCSTALLLTGVAAQAQEACSTYTVQPGDNLRYIARDAYGDADLYRLIYEANVDKIGAKADIIEIGTTLTLPCDPKAEATATGASAEPAAEPVAETVTPVAASATETEAPATETTAAASAERPIAMVTGNGYAPFTDEMLPGGGMMTQLVEMATFRADPAIAYNVSFINDWQAHIDALLPSGAYDLSFPWVRPNCEGTMLSPADQARCTDFAFSAPFYEIVDGFFATRESGLIEVTKASDFAGKRICRPEGYTTGVLDTAGLTAPTITLVRSEDVEDCFRALSAGEVDLVSVDTEVGDATVAKLGLIQTVGTNPHLSTIVSLHVIAHKSNPRAVAMLGQLDAGLIEMYQSGEWYEIVSTALARQRAQE